MGGGGGGGIGLNPARCVFNLRRSIVVKPGIHFLPNIDYYNMLFNDTCLYFKVSYCGFLLVFNSVQGLVYGTVCHTYTSC